MLVSTLRYDERNAYLRLSDTLMQYLPPKPINITLLCIGTDRVTGDAFGPLVGTFLTGFGLKPMGTLADPVHAGNLASYQEKFAPGQFVVAVDACLGSLRSVGQLNLYDGPITPGAGVGKTLEPVGRVGITMNVNVGGFMENQVLANTRLSLVFSGAQITALAIYRAMSLGGQLTLAQISCTRQ